MAEAVQGERRLDPAIIQAAIEWSARLWSGEASDADCRACDSWRSQHPDHELAWQRIAGISARLRDLPGDVALPALRSRRRVSRRMLLGLALGGGVTLLGMRWWPGADIRSAVGEISQLRLPDGGEVLLDSDSAINIEYGADIRRVVLLRGRLLVHTHPDPGHRLFMVTTRDGNAVAHGTRYSVTLAEHYTDVQVLQGQVELRPASGRPGRLLLSGQAGRYDAGDVRQDGPQQAREPGWPQGVLAAEAMPLPEFLAELGRYRSGVLRWDDSLRPVRVSGVFSLRDTDSALRALADALPVRIQSYTRWLTLVRAR